VKSNLTVEQQKLVRTPAFKKWFGDWENSPETASKVVSRSNDECIVAKIDQWYINYGNKEITDKVNKYLEQFNMFNNVSLNDIKIASNWLNEWPCSRNCGLGTKLQGTTQLIDSLSDSTIYMAYYTVSHIVSKIPMEYITYDLWNYVFMNKQKPILPTEYDGIVEQMKKEFQYWYPVNVRFSGKDLIRNHLTMCLYNHMMIWNDVKFMPQSYFVNGYIMLNGEKMSKSTGNFMTLNDAVQKYGADATRVALTLAESGVSDANFTDEYAESAIIMLYTEKSWIDEHLKHLSTNNTLGFWEKVFQNEINYYVQEITNSLENLKIRKAFVELQLLINAKNKYCSIYKNYLPKTDAYYQMCYAYTDVFLTLLYPFAPFIVETVWKENPSINFNNNWPVVKSFDRKCSWLYDCMFNTLAVIQKNSQKTKKPKQNITMNVTVISQYSTSEITVAELLIALLKIHQPINWFQYPKWEELVDKLSDICIDSTAKSTVGKFRKEAKSAINKYGLEWLTWITQSTNDEYIMYNEWLSIFTQKFCSNVVITKVNGSDKYSFKNCPGKPIIETMIQ